MLIAIALAVLLSSCGGQVRSAADDGDTVSLRYAKLLTLIRHQGYSVVTINHPWRTDAVLHQYVLVPADSDMPSDLPEGTLIRTPLRRSVVFTTVHCSLLSMLHCEASVAGVADLKYIKAPYVREGVQKGLIEDCGDGMSPVIEKIIDLHPDGLLLSPFENSGGYGQLEEIDIPIVECAEYMEPSPLGRAEWIRFYGMLYGCEREADSLFALVDKNYHTLKRRTANVLHRPTTLLDKITGSVWYVPGGRSTIGRMLADAGADYPWATDERSGSVALPFESVLEHAGESDVWLLRYSGKVPLTRQQLLSEHWGYKQFRAFNIGNVYGCNVEQSLFYEESPFRPDWLLSDFIRIIHPDALPNHVLRYYHLVK